VVTEEELAFLKVHLAELSPTVLKQLKRDIVAEKRREAEVPAKAKGSGERPSGSQPGSAGEWISPSKKALRVTAGKPKANQLNSSDSGGPMDPATRCPAPGPMAGAASAPLTARAKGTLAQGPVGKSTASTGEQAASSGGQHHWHTLGLSLTPSPPRAKQAKWDA
jgi:hypothetical protein